MEFKSVFPCQTLHFTQSLAGHRRPFGPVTFEKSFIVPSKMVFPEVEFQTGGRYFARYEQFLCDQYVMCKLFRE